MTLRPDSLEAAPYNPAQDDDKMRATMVDPGAGLGFPSRWIRCMAAEILNLKAARNAGIDAQHELHEQLYQARLALTARALQEKEAVELLRKARRAAIKMGETKFEAWDAALDELLAVVGSDAVGMLLVLDAVEGDSDE